MAWVHLSYKDYELEENPAIISWLQLFMVKQLDKQPHSEGWIAEFQELIEVNAGVDAYKYIFFDDSIDTPEKHDWAIHFLQQCVHIIASMTYKEYSDYIGEDIVCEENLKRVKKVLADYLLMIEGRYLASDLA